MKKSSILIVEDQRDLARMLQSGLNAAAPGSNVVNVPSAEEALLVAGQRRFDVLIIDVVLPGMSGLVLMDRLRIQQPEARTILMTGSADHEIRKRVANAGADAFFFKPVEINAILDALTRFETGTAPLPPLVEETEPAEPEERLDEQLAALRQKMDAHSVLLLDERGRTLIQAGDLPPGVDPNVLYPALLGAFSAAARVSTNLGMRIPEDVQVFPGRNLEIYMAHVGEAVALVAVLPNGIPNQAAEAVPTVQNAASDLRRLLVQIGLPADPVAEEPPQDEPVEEVAEEDPAAAAEMESLLEGAGALTLSADEIDAFWDTADKSMDTGSLNPDNLSFDQARKIGLTPEEE
ncbi:MAG: response regulator [Anaerolineales bacterium]|nr:response regulator [Anaerolineales bacterium]